MLDDSDTHLSHHDHACNACGICIHTHTHARRYPLKNHPDFPFDDNVSSDRSSWTDLHAGVYSYVQ